jgi:hypothetical protein
LPNRYRFKGSAYAASGVITTPFSEVIEVQAPAALAEFGGFGSSSVSDFRHREILRFDRAHSEVTGSRTHIGEQGETYSTLVRSTVEGLNILGIVMADKVVAHQVTTYRTAEREPENSVTLAGSHFENLKIAGVRLDVDMNTAVLDKYSQHKNFVRAWGDAPVKDLFGNAGLRAAYAAAPNEVKAYLAEPPAADAAAMPQNAHGQSTVSIVKGVRPVNQNNALESYGHVIHIEGFGTIRLGEVHICRHTRALTMIHIHFGCPYEGDVGITGTADGGTGS